MKNIYIALMFSSILVFFSSCHDILEEDTRSQISDNYLYSELGFEAGLNAAYAFTRVVYCSQETPGYLTETGTDLWTHGTGGDQSWAYYNANLRSTNGWNDRSWREPYQAINALNAVIERAPVVADISEDLKNIRVGEAKFLRALFYFHLVRQWGPVHLTLEETQGVEREAFRSPRADVYEAIINDLNAAIQALPNVASDYGRATKPAAEHLLALVHLTRAGFEDSAQPNDYNNAAQLAKNVINNYNFRLLDDFADVFEFDADRHAEVVWAVQNSKDIMLAGFGGNYTHAMFLPRYEQLPGMQRSMELGRAWSRHMPTSYAFNDLWDRQYDDRADKTLSRVFYSNQPGSFTSTNGHAIQLALGDTAAYFPTEVWSAEKISNAGYSVINPGQWSRVIYPRILKFTDPARVDDMDMRGSRDFIVMRLAETYLIAAEALMMMNELDEAATYVNVVRSRAAKKGATEAETEANRLAMQIAPNQLSVDFILEERGRELMGEMMRRHDLVRTGKLLERVHNYNPDASAQIQPFHVLRPIPQNQIDRSTTDFGQNEGY